MIDIVLVSLDLTKATGGIVHRMCSASHDVQYNGHTYRAVGDLLSIDDIESTADLTTLGTSITLSGIDPAYRQEIDNGGFLRAPIDIMIAQLPEGSDTVPDNTAGYYHRGTCDTPNTEIDYSTGSLTIAINTQSVFGNLDKIPDLCRTSQSSHEARHPGDKFFTFVAAVTQEEKWIS